MDPELVIAKRCVDNRTARHVLVAHGNAVAGLALELAKRIDQPVDLDFLREAAILHDVGMLETRIPQLGCHGPYPYICHGVLGRRMLDEEGLPGHALVCERHVGLGLTAREIRRQKLPLPVRDMVPETVEEKLVCYADKFFSKYGLDRPRMKTIEEVEQEAGTFGPDNLAVLHRMKKLFGVP
ncbi:MAG: HDIG domain-containing metalloprotein [Desulfatibacillaceae bacterium]